MQINKQDAIKLAKKYQPVSGCMLLEPFGNVDLTESQIAEIIDLACKSPALSRSH